MRFMQQLWLVLLVTFWLTVAAMLVGRGSFFYVQSVFGFSDVEKLWMAVAYGLVGVAGATLSHRIAVRWMERRTLALMFGGLAMTLTFTAIGADTAWIVVSGCAASSFFISGSWPVIESYVSAGRTPTQTRLAVGRFNLSWAMAYPIPIAATGLILTHWRVGLFALPAVMAALLLLPLLPLPAHPTHIAKADPSRPGPLEMALLARQLRAARWLMMQGYAMIFILAPLFPTILLEHLKLDVIFATPLASSVDAARVIAFAALYFWSGWHGRKRWLVWGAVLMPAGFFLVLYGTSVWLVLTGSVVFGLMHGVVYYSALHYAMVVENASVEAGSTHEALIGYSLALGPGVSLIGNATGNIAYGIIPLMLICTLGGLSPLVRRVAEKMNV